MPSESIIEKPPGEMTLPESDGKQIEEVEDYLQLEINKYGVTKSLIKHWIFKPNFKRRFRTKQNSAMFIFQLGLLLLR